MANLHLCLCVETLFTKRQLSYAKLAVKFPHKVETAWWVGVPLKGCLNDPLSASYTQAWTNR